MKRGAWARGVAANTTRETRAHAAPRQSGISRSIAERSGEGEGRASNARAWRELSRGGNATADRSSVAVPKAASAPALNALRWQLGCTETIMRHPSTHAVGRRAHQEWLTGGSLSSYHRPFTIDD
jgi:hypothetical protein